LTVFGVLLAQTKVEKLSQVSAKAEAETKRRNATAVSKTRAVWFMARSISRTMHVPCHSRRKIVEM
jgi:hypothetical protein